MQHIEILTEGFTYNTICFKRVDSTFNPRDETKKFIEDGWCMRLAVWKQSKAKYINAIRPRFEGLLKNKSLLTVLVSNRTTYRQVVGARAHGLERSFEFTGFDNPNALSFMSVVETNDGKILLGWRDSGDWDAGWEISGGFYNDPDINKHPFTAPRHRLKADWNIQDNQIEEQRGLVIFRNQEILETTLVFFFRLKELAKNVMKLSHANMSTISYAHGLLQRQLPSGSHPPTRVVLGLYDYLSNR